MHQASSYLLPLTGLLLRSLTGQESESSERSDIKFSATRSFAISGLHHRVAERVLGTFKTQREAIDRTKRQGHHPLFARVRHLNDKKNPDPAIGVGIADAFLAPRNKRLAANIKRGPRGWITSAL
jgi:hypothetical protein